MIHDVVFVVDWGFLLFFLVLNGFYTFLFALSLVEVVGRSRRRVDDELHHALRSHYTPPISIIAPAFNEGVTIVDSVNAHLNVRYPELEVVVVNDGSKDDTAQVMIRAFDMYPVQASFRRELACKPVRGVYRSRREPRLTFVDKENGGKADALNCGINVARYPLVCGIDADTLILPDGLLKLAMPFMEEPDRTIATGGTIRVANGCTTEDGTIRRVGLPKSMVATFQVVEYLRAFLFGRVGWNQLGGPLIISGAFGLFDRKAVVEAGGYEHSSIGEDMELVVRMHRLYLEKGRPYAIRFVHDATCYTEVPEDLGVLSRQRNRWQRGLIDTLKIHRRMLLNPRYGMVGMIGFPFFALFEMVGPLVELFGILFVPLSYVLGFVDVPFMLLFLFVAVLFGVMLSIGGLVLEELSVGAYPKVGHLLRLAWYAVLENVGYRQLTLIYRVQGIWAYLRGQKQWGAMVRRGFKPAGA